MDIAAYLSLQGASGKHPCLSVCVFVCVCVYVDGLTVTGAVTVTTLPSSIRSSLARWQSSRTWSSGMGRHERSCAIALQAAVSRRSESWASGWHGMNTDLSRSLMMGRQRKRERERDAARRSAGRADAIVGEAQQMAMTCRERGESAGAHRNRRLVGAGRVTRGDKTQAGDGKTELEAYRVSHEVLRPKEVETCAASGCIESGMPLSLVGSSTAAVIAVFQQTPAAALALCRPKARDRGS